MDEDPSSPEDGLEEALRRALSAAVGGVEPGASGLERIRARTGTRPPRSWLFAVLAGLAERARSWTWRGHWAWPESLPWRATPPWRRRRARNRKGAPGAETGDTTRPLPRQRPLPRRGAWWLRPGAALAGIAVILCLGLIVRPFRHAIIQASSTVLKGGTSQQRGAAGTDGNGTRTTVEGGTPPASPATPGGSRARPTSVSGIAGRPGTTSLKTAPSLVCDNPAASGVSPDSTGPKPLPADTAPAGSSPSPWTTWSPHPVTSSPVSSVQPSYLDRSASTCPVASATPTSTSATSAVAASGFPSPSTGASGTSSAATPTVSVSDTSPTTTASPAPTYPAWAGAPAGRHRSRAGTRHGRLRFARARR